MRAEPGPGARYAAAWHDCGMATTRNIEAASATEARLEELLTDAAEFFEAYLWESRHGQAARHKLAGEKLEEEAIRGFGVGYAPIGPYVLMNHLGGLGYSVDELVATGLATRSARGGVHAYFRSRLMFPVRDERGQVHGFAALGTHMGPSWALWITSPETAVYRRADSVFALERAAPEIAAAGVALVRPDCIEVIRSHQEGEGNAVTVHTNWVTEQQRAALAVGLRGGVEALELDLPPGIGVDATGSGASEELPLDSESAGSRRAGAPSAAADPPRHLNLKRLAIVTATALAAINAWTGGPLLAVWVGSQVQSGHLLSMRGVVSVVVVLALTELVLLGALTWLNLTYDRLVGRPRVAGQTSPWQRAMRGDRVQDIRSRFGMSAPEKVVAACVVACVLVFEIWFFFFAGSSI
jgi:DNA primase catalytic core, N-terminal domain